MKLKSIILSKWHDILGNKQLSTIAATSQLQMKIHEMTEDKNSLFITVLGLLRNGNKGVKRNSGHTAHELRISSNKQEDLKIKKQSHRRESMDLGGLGLLSNCNAFPNMIYNGGEKLSNGDTLHLS